jgi:hypothetical protein
MKERSIKELLVILREKDKHLKLPCGDTGCRNPHEREYRGCDVCKFNLNHNNMKDNEPCQVRQKVNTNSLKDLAIYLSGVKDGKGNLLPLGTVVLDDLWNAIRYLNGDSGFIADRDLDK